ncbi:uncharacterized protein [Epargyreus clarus]|uniref:uncharacterized protein n=1 Tax=Epargyreus clarus TaxID=520877 RepID=UPI003C2E862D
MTKVVPKKKPVTFIDETWIHSHYTVSKCWQNSSDSSIRKNHSPGQRWIVVHAGNENGFVQGAELLYKCKSTTGDYHNEMDASNFTKWIKEKLIPNLPPNGIIVMDNAPYHSKQANKPPNYSARKNEMQTWLHEHYIEFNDKMTKRELYMLIKRNKPIKVYFIDEIFRAHGHEVLRLPPYHCDLNPIEYIWNLIKQRVADKNVDQLEKDIERLTKEAIQNISPEDWKKECNHVDRLRDKFWHNDRLYELEERELIISLGGEDSDSESETQDNILSNEEDDDNDSVTTMSGVEAFSE